MSTRVVIGTGQALGNGRDAANLCVGVTRALPTHILSVVGGRMAEKAWPLGIDASIS